MRLALVSGRRCEAGPGLPGVCQKCDSPLIPKCGKLRAWHWAHHGERHCDPWWEETDWHIDWKNRFPVVWQESVLHAGDGEKHIADVRTPDGRVIEFQHSPLAEEERRARESFYKSMVWVVDGLARKRDLRSFDKTRHLVCQNPPVYSGYAIECALLRDWVGRPVDVFLDFGAREEEISSFGGPILWHLHPNSEGQVILTPVPGANFIEALHQAMPFRRIRINRVKTPALIVPTPFYRRHPESFQQYSRRKQRSRPRF
jgi:competence protein CoiA